MDLFGEDRCLWGSNFPIEKLWASYGAVLAAHDAATAGLGDAAAVAEAQELARRSAEFVALGQWDEALALAEASLLIGRALSPAIVSNIILHRDRNEATVVVNEDQLSKAIGKEGKNVRLAAKLTEEAAERRRLQHEVALKLIDCGEDAQQAIDRLQLDQVGQYAFRWMAGRNFFKPICPPFQPTCAVLRYVSRNDSGTTT